jgi:glycosyltransferase involved in cell wall biosynthesis
MHFSVVICTHNRCDILETALRSHVALTQPVGVSRELIVVDNASRDRTAEVVREFGTNAPFSVRYVHEGRLGHSFALNAGVAAASGDIIAFTDDDAFPEPHWLSSMHQEFLDAQVGWVFGPVTPVWEGRRPSWYGPEVAGWFAILDYGTERFLAQDPRRPFFGVNHACRRDILLRLGGYREDLGIFGSRGGAGNDVDLYCRALAAGVRILYTPAMTVGHWIPAQRCEKTFYRRKMWNSTELYFGNALSDPPARPWLLQLPRFFFRKPVDHLFHWAVQLLRRNRSGAFYHELQAMLFTGVIYRALLHRVQRRASHAPQTVASGALRHG